ncbi:MAG: hypothetical protein O2913_00820 [Chloroflexi bacterium]|nr:hypothetical protein [Chloroflexota bacterium]
MERLLYGKQTKNLSVRQARKQAKERVVTQTRKSVGLSRGLHQGLQKRLYQGLYQGSQIQAHDAIAAPETASVAPLATDVIRPSPVAIPTTETKIRKVALLSGETVTHTFYPEEGLASQPRDQGLMLVLTNQRVISFGSRDGRRETVLMPVEEVKVVAVQSGLRSKVMLFQGGLTVLAGVVIYLVLMYWLEGKFEDPDIPLIRMGLVAFLVFLAILAGVGMISQFYFSKPDGEVAFQGDGVKLVFPFRGEAAENDIYQVVNSTFAARQSVNGNSAIEYSRQGVT